MLVCKFCGAEFAANDNKPGPHPNCCSSLCRRRYYHGSDFDELSREHFCIHCGKTLDYPRQKKFCSKECYRLDRLKGVDFVPHTSSCEQCGATFEAKRATQRFCTPVCRKRAGRQREREKRKGQERPRIISVTYTCVYCGKDYHPKGRERNTYCSRECSYADKKAAWRDNLRLGYRERICQIECVHCNKQVFAADAYSSRCCSRECHEAYYRYTCIVCGITRIGTAFGQVVCPGVCRDEYSRMMEFERSKRKHEQKIKPRECKQCGEVFIPHYGSKKRNFCSKKCLRKASEKNKARGNHQQRAKHYGVKYEWFSDLTILKRDGWQCYICGCSTPKELRGTYENNAPEIDHIIPLSKGGSHTKDNVRCCCRACNGAKNDMTLKEMKKARVNQAKQMVLL